MSEKEFLARARSMLDAYARRMSRLRKVVEGDAKLKRVEVKGYRVRSYRVRPHVRWL